MGRVPFTRSTFQACQATTSGRLFHGRMSACSKASHARRENMVWQTYALPPVTGADAPYAGPSQISSTKSTLVATDWSHRTVANILKAGPASVGFQKLSAPP